MFRKIKQIILKIREDHKLCLGFRLSRMYTLKCMNVQRKFLSDYKIIVIAFC